MPEKTRVVAVDDHPVVVEGVMAMVTRESPDIELVGNATTWEGLRKVLTGLDRAPDLALVDLHLGDGSDPNNYIAELTERGIRVVVLTSEIRPIPIRQALVAGAVGLALKSDPPDQIVRVVRAAASGDFAVFSDLAFVLITDAAMAARLAPREIEVLSLLADGVPRKSVGSRMDPPVSTSTVVTYLNRACERYREIGREVYSSGDAVRAAQADGFLKSPHER